MKITFKIILLIGLLLSYSICQTLSIVTWNIRDFGRSKSNSQLLIIANTLKNYDLVTIQEVVASDPAGAQKIAILADELNRTGAKWDFSISDKTDSPSSYICERYAILWKTSSLVQMGEPFLDKQLAHLIYREPFISKFKIKGTNTEFFIINYHSRKYNDNPELEIKNFKKYPKRLNTSNFIIAGDFNLTDSHTVWNPLKSMGFKPSIRNNPTTLKKSCTTDGKYRNHAIDNIFYNSNIYNKVKSGVIDIVGDCDNLEKVRKLSDHLPMFLEISY